MKRANDQNNESFRRAAASLAASMSDGGYRSVLFSSATSGEGCSTVVHKIACQLVQEFGLRTLVIELDLDHPGHATSLGVKRGKSLHAIAAGELAARDCVQTVAEGYSLIPGHDAAAGPRRRIDLATTVRSVLADLEPEYDCVLLDTPPVSDRSEALRVCAVVPRLMLVVEAGGVRFEVLKRVRRQLEIEGVTIVGAILNKHRRFIPNWIYKWLMG